MITEAVQKLSTYENLSCAMARSVMEEMMTGRCTASQIASYLVALAMKKPSVDEIVGSAQGMRAQAIAVRDASDALEIVGTGGDHAGTFNISTTIGVRHRQRGRQSRQARQPGRHFPKRGGRLSRSARGQFGCRRQPVPAAA